LVINIGAIFIIILNSLICPPQAQPLNVLQLLWVNIMMDTFAAMALATEEPSDALLDQKPYSRKDSIFTPVMWRNIIGQTIFQIILFNGLLFYFRFKNDGSFNFIDTSAGSDDCDWFGRM
jgi:magnesium-transporting ATPase (P-type)